MTSIHQIYSEAVKSVIKQVGNNVVLGVPLGIGKPIGFLNALYLFAKETPSINLTIITALTLSRPRFKHEIERRFLVPILDRILQDYEEPLYERDRELQIIPKNIRVLEFFLSPAKFINNAYVQQNYISTTYTNAVRDISFYGINVIAQLVSADNDYPETYSLSCNTDLFQACVTNMHASKRPIVILGEVNPKLPFMLEEAIVPEKVFTDIIDTAHYKTIFSLPHEPITIQEHAIGIYTSTFIQDNSCLQIGIGSLSNALANAMIMRHQENSAYNSICQMLKLNNRYSTYTQGIYASTEMLSDAYINLYKTTILKKKVYNDVTLQKLLNKNIINEEISLSTLQILVTHKIISNCITHKQFLWLQKCGIFRKDIIFQDKHIHLPNGKKFLPLVDKSARDLEIYCLGDNLLNPHILHAGFFIGSNDLYSVLQQLPPSERKLFAMTSIAHTNSLRLNPKLLSEQRRCARFVNTALMITVNGSVVSDGITNIQELSGVGGQYDFAAMSQELKDSISIINCRSTRPTATGEVSNIVFDYPNLTLPRFLRDVFITEYGIEDCRSKTDAEVIKSLINICDSRFQNNLLMQCKRAGKVESNYSIPKQYTNNYPTTLIRKFNPYFKQGYFSAYPFGSDLTDIEMTIADALLFLKSASKIMLLVYFLQGIITRMNNPQIFQRLDLIRTNTISEYFYKNAIKAALKNLGKN